MCVGRGHLLTGGLKQAFLYVGLKEEYRDVFRFLFDINGIAEQLRFTRVPFGVGASPFMLGAALQHDFDCYPGQFYETETI